MYSVSFIRQVGFHSFYRTRRPLGWVEVQLCCFLGPSELDGVVLTCFVMCGFCNVWVCVCMCAFCNVWVCVCVGFVMCGFCNMWVCVCVGFVMCGCVYVWVL